MLKVDTKVVKCFDVVVRYNQSFCLIVYTELQLKGSFGKAELIPEKVTLTPDAVRTMQTRYVTSLVEEDIHRTCL